MDLENQANWEKIAEINKVAIKPDGANNAYIPIPSFDVLANGRIFIIDCHSKSASPHWVYACSFLQNVKVGIDLSQSMASYSARKIFFKRKNLIKFSQLVEIFTVKIPYWIEDLNLIIYKYIGQDDESVIDLLKIIDKKVTDLSDFGN
jgi:hypothetical protein